MNESKHSKGSCKSCDGHIEFPEEAVGLSVACPHCGKNTELVISGETAPVPVESRGRSPLVWLAVILAIVALGGVGIFAWQRQKSGSSPASTATDTKNAPAVPKLPKSPDDLQASGIALEKPRGSGLVYATGLIKNASDHQRFGVKVELELFNNSGVKAGTATDYVQVLEPRREWRFRALVLDPKAVEARLGKITEDQ